MKRWFGPSIKIGATVRLNGHDMPMSPKTFEVMDGDTLIIDLKVDIPVRVREDETPGVIIHRGIEVIAAKEEA